MNVFSKYSVVIHCTILRPYGTNDFKVFLQHCSLFKEAECSVLSIIFIETSLINPLRF